MASMIKFLLWCILLTLCWPLALLALAIFPVIWLISLPFRLLGLLLHSLLPLAIVAGALWLVWAIVTLPFRLLGVGPYRTVRPAL
jgi:hypothetical protein